MPSDAEASMSGFQWSQQQQKFLDLLQDKDNCQLSIAELCRKAGFPNPGPWYRAAKNAQFREAVRALRAANGHGSSNPDEQVNRDVPPLNKTHQRFFNVLQVEENRQIPVAELCHKAGFPNYGHWYRALEHPQFRAAVEALGCKIGRPKQNSDNPPAPKKLPPRSKAYQKILDLLQVEENRKLSITELCRKAGFASKKPWYQALEYPEFRAAVEALGVEINRLGFYFNDEAVPKDPEWSETHQRFLDVLEVEENRELSIIELCQKAGFTHNSAWYRALAHPQFLADVEALGMDVDRSNLYLKGKAKAQQAILAVLEDEANRHLPIVEVCRKAGYSDDQWYRSLQSQDFVNALQALGVAIRRIEYNEDGWTEVQQRLLDVLEEPDNRKLTMTEICHLAGYPNYTYWARACRNPRFVAVVEAFGLKPWTKGRNEHGFTRAQQRFLDFLEENPVITAGELCRKLGYTSTSSWTDVIQDRRFIQELAARRFQVERKEQLHDGWTWGHKDLLLVLQDKDNRELPIKQICRIAGYSNQVWYHAVRNEPAVSAMKDLGVRIQRSGPDEEGWTWSEQRLLAVLDDEANRDLPIPELCRKARYSSVAPWYKSLTSEQFTQALQAWGVPIVRQHPPFIPHTQVKLAMNVQEALSKDIWDIRQLKPDYPKHRSPSSYIVDFTWIENPQLRQQVKRYLQTQLPRWHGSTFSGQLYAIKSVLSCLPADVDIGAITRQHIEAILPEVLVKHSDSWAMRSLGATRSMFQYMAHSQYWHGPRPPANLIDREDIPSSNDNLPRPIPPDVLAQFDPLLEQAVQAIISEQTPPILEPIFWDALLILRNTGMRFADLAHLEAPNAQNRGGCLGQDADEDHWVHIQAEKTKMGREHQIPTLDEDGTVAAILRQSQRVKNIPNHFNESYLFRTQERVLTYSAFYKALKKLSPYLIYMDQPYEITPHQFRHTLATKMYEATGDIVAVKEFLGHRSLSMTLRYVKVYNQGVQAKYYDYRARTRQQNYKLSRTTTQLLGAGMSSRNPGEPLAGWVDGYEGKLYRFELLDGLGICEQPPGLQLPCLKGQCSTRCTKLHVGNQHLPVWKNRVSSLQKTIAALRGCPGYEGSCQQHEQELRQTEKVIATIQKEGFWDGRIHNVEES